jgi:hypothetical protein
MSNHFLGFALGDGLFVVVADAVGAGAGFGGDGANVFGEARR